MALKLKSLVGKTVLVQFRAPYCMARRDGDAVLPMGVETSKGAYEYVSVPFLAGEIVEREGQLFIRYKDDRKYLIDALVSEDLIAFVTVAPAIEVQAPGIIVSG